jgi:KUP system potassium uptake protein
MSTTTTIVPSAAGVEPAGEHNGLNGRRWKLLALGSLGVVYGDIGTSPLYALRECFYGADPDHRLAVTELNVLGVLSLIFWALTLIISIKYLVFILRADNQGEGGILALMAQLIPRQKGAPKRAVVITLALLGAAFLYADSMITPAISVLSAVEGIGIAAPALLDYVVLIAVGILVPLFWMQSRGTARVGAVFGPLMLAWFGVLAALGVWHIAKMPGVLVAINPMYGWEFFQHNGWHGFLILGAVFLVVTGGEALYADIGHFGAFPIRVSWYGVVFPALLLNYFGQGSLLLRDTSARVHPLFHMVDGWALYPLIAIATMAAIMASQAVITGAFSLTLQAIQLGYCPRLRIEHTSHEQFGQIYIPAVNRALMIASVALILGFRSSSNLAAAYGLAITITMVVTMMLFYRLVRDRWHWSPAIAVPFAIFFLAIDLAFFGANMLKIFHGGWFPLVIAGTVFIMMTTWRDGRQLLAARLRASMLSTELFIADLMSNPLLRVPGTAVFMSGNPMGTPLALRQNVAHNHVLHECNIILGVQTTEVPHVDEAHRVESEEIGEGFFRVSLNYGFMEEPDVPRDLTPAACLGHDVKLEQVSYFLGRETLIATATPGMALWRESLFAFLSRNSQPATLFFHLPPDRVVEIGAQVEL